MTAAIRQALDDLLEGIGDGEVTDERGDSYCIACRIVLQDTPEYCAARRAFNDSVAQRSALFAKMVQGGMAERSAYDLSNGLVDSPELPNQIPHRDPCPLAVIRKEFA